MGWMKNSKGAPSASLTMSFVAFLVVTAWLAGWLIATPFGAVLPPFEAATAMAYLSPMLALYFGRRWTLAHGDTTASGTGEKYLINPAKSDVVEDGSDQGNT